MRILYVTDLHGDATKYERALEAARSEAVSAVINGGDMLPRGAGLEGQEAFIREFLDPHFSEYDREGISYVTSLGNDDLSVLDELFDGVCEEHASVVNLAQRRSALNGFEFIGMNWVVDYPFRLKDRCRMDTDDYEFQEQLGTGILSTPDGFVELDDWFAYARTLPTIEQELSRLVRPRDSGRTVCVFHMPPSGLGLDQCGHGPRVGSEAVRAFIEREQPRITLHGHIHESPDAAGCWRAELGDTVCIQPGQSDEGGPLTWVSIDIDDMRFDRHIS